MCLPKRFEIFSLKQPDRYYHSRAAKNTAAPQAFTSAASTSASSPAIQAHTSDRLTDETDADIPGPSGPLLSHSPADLPSFMKGVRVFFYNLPVSERKRLSRYLITYPF